MLLLISILSAISSIYRSAVDIITDCHTIVRKFGVAIDAEDIRAGCEMSVTPRSVALGFTNAPGSMAIAA